MKLHGSRVLDVPREAVFLAIRDPQVLLAVIPGCDAIEAIGDGEYRGRISLRLPGVVGTYQTLVRLVDTDSPSRGVLTGEVTGNLGSITGRAAFHLTETPGGGTTVDYEGDAVVGGPLARFDGRFLEGLAGSLIGQGLANLETRLREEATR